MLEVKLSKLDVLWQERTQLCTRAFKLGAEGDILRSQAKVKFAEARVLGETSPKSQVLIGEAYQLLAKSHDLYAESQRLCVQAHWLWVNGVTKVIGKTTFQWSDKNSTCRLGTGQVFYTLSKIVV
jgi:hypothetical protein